MNANSCVICNAYLPEGGGLVCKICSEKFSYLPIVQTNNLNITADEYQKAALRTAFPNLSKEQKLENGLMGLAGEAGEAIDILKKHLFHGHALDHVHLAKELGDVAWYLAVTANALGYDLSTIFQMNIEKLKERYPEGFDSNLSINRSPSDI